MAEEHLRDRNGQALTGLRPSPRSLCDFTWVESGDGCRGCEDMDHQTSADRTSRPGQTPPKDCPTPRRNAQRSRHRQSSRRVTIEWAVIVAIVVILAGLLLAFGGDGAGVRIGGHG